MICVKVGLCCEEVVRRLILRFVMYPMFKCLIGKRVKVVESEKVGATMVIYVYLSMIFKSELALW